MNDNLDKAIVKASSCIKRINTAAGLPEDVMAILEGEWQKVISSYVAPVVETLRQDVNISSVEIAENSRHEQETHKIMLDWKTEADWLKSDNKQYKERMKLLGDSLTKILKADGVLLYDAEPTGPELLVAAEDYLNSNKVV